jgi:hypothetical protein
MFNMVVKKGDVEVACIGTKSVEGLNQRGCLEVEGEKPTHNRLSPLPLPTWEGSRYFLC